MATKLNFFKAILCLCRNWRRRGGLVILSNHPAIVMGQRQKRWKKTKPLKWEMFQVRCQIVVPFQTSSTKSVSQILQYSLLHYPHLANHEIYAVSFVWPGI